MIVKLQTLEDDGVFHLGYVETPVHLHADTRMKAETRDEFVSAYLADLYSEFIETGPVSDAEFLEYLVGQGWTEADGPDLVVTL